MYLRAALNLEFSCLYIPRLGKRELLQIMLSEVTQVMLTALGQKWEQHLELSNSRKHIH